MPNEPVMVAVKLDGGTVIVMKKPVGVELLVYDFDVMNLKCEDVVDIKGRPCIITRYDEARNILGKGMEVTDGKA